MSNRCAACKFLRRKCPEDCIFSPYFPGDNPQRFASVHKIYGASNVSKMLQQVPAHSRADTAESLFIEAENRIINPVYGSAGIITLLNQELSDKNSELARLQAELAAYKVQSYYSKIAAGPVEINSYNAQVHSRFGVGPLEQHQQLGPEVHSGFVVGPFHQQPQPLGPAPGFVNMGPFLQQQQQQQQQLGPVQQQSGFVNAFLPAQNGVNQSGFGPSNSNNWNC